MGLRLIRRKVWILLFDDRDCEKVPGAWLLHLFWTAELLFLGGDNAAILAAEVAGLGLADRLSSLARHDAILIGYSA
jgi:hypothetical protein